MTLNRRVAGLIAGELKRQQSTLSLIPSENYVSPAVQEAQRSCFTNKYAEGYPNKRYYGGTRYCDELELLAQTLAGEVFSTDYRVNVQPYSGSPANLAVYLALVQPGETVMGMELSAGGHLTHGHKVSATGSLFHSVQYGVTPDGWLDYDAIEQLAAEHKPKLIVAGTTAYSRTLDFARFGRIAKKVGAHLLADISHISGLVATGLHPTPFGHADVVMTTTHKMLRGPRGALLFSKSEELATAINKQVFPGLQGGPHMHTIAAIAQALSEAKSPKYAKYCQAIVENAGAMVQVLISRGFSIVTGGTDNHLWLIDLRSKNLTGQAAQDLLEKHGIVANKNSIPHDTSGPFKPNGLRLGTPAITTRGFNALAAKELADIITTILDGQRWDKTKLLRLIARHPIPSS